MAGSILQHIQYNTHKREKKIDEREKERERVRERRERVRETIQYYSTAGCRVPWTGVIPLETPTMNTRAAWIRANPVRNLTKYSISAFKVEEVLPTSPLIGMKGGSKEGRKEVM